MGETCGCGCDHEMDKPVQYVCDGCEGECSCSTIGFDELPNTTPYCCGAPMKRIK